MPLFVGLGAMIDHGVMGKNPARRSVGHLDLSAARVPDHTVCPSCVHEVDHLVADRYLLPRGRQQAPVRKGFFEAARTLSGVGVAVMVSWQRNTGDTEGQ